MTNMNDKNLHITFSEDGTKPSIVVEAAHIYTNELPGLEHTLGAKIGSQICQILELLNFNPQKWLFIDNYNPQFDPKPKELDVGEYNALLSGLGFSPEVTVYEKDLVGPAKEALEHLVAHHFAGQHYPSGKYLLHKGNILLYDPEKDRYACSLLDACLYTEKAKQSDCSVTVLDQQFKSQQKGTLTILKKLGIDVSKIIPVYYSTPLAVHHESVAPANVYVNGGFHCSNDTPGTIVDIIGILKLLGRISESVPMKTGFDLEVIKNVI